MKLLITILDKINIQTRRKYIENNLQNRIDKILKPSSSSRFQIEPPTDEESDLEGSGVTKIIIPNNIIEIWTRLEVLLGLKLSGHTDTLTESSNLIDELYKRGEIQSEQQYKNAINKFISN